MFGPFYRYIGMAPPDGVPSTFVKFQQWYTQARPYKAPLPYHVYSVSCGGVLFFANETPPASESGMPTSYALLKAYESFKDKIGSRADLMTGIAERKQSLDMVVKRAIQLTTFARQLRRFDFAGAGKTLGIRPTYSPRRRNPMTGEPYYRPNRLRRKAEAFADNFIEYSFGWAPLVGDISTALDVLIRGPLPIKISASGSDSRLWWKHREEGPYSREFDTAYYSVRVYLRAQLVLQNPDLLLANQLGLVNPVATAWELVPFSFLVDHLTSVGAYLSSATDFVGVELRNPCTSTTYEYTRDRLAASGASSPYWYSYTDRIRSKGFKRVPGAIPGPPLTLRPQTGLSLHRGGIYISLLLQQLKGK